MPAFAKIGVKYPRGDVCGEEVWGTNLSSGISYTRC